MRLYLAAVYTTGIHLRSRYFLQGTPREREARLGCPNILESYHYVHSETRVRHMRTDKVRVFLDSGAFSAFTLGKEIDLEGYCRYIKDNADIIDVASVLDGIGDPQKTYENQCAMESNGTRPLPCFHYGEDERYLEYYIGRYDHITLGGMVPIAKPQLRLWLDRIWSRYLCDSKGRPKLKVHGFGMTSLDLMVRYPWYSVDSSSWVQIASSGNVFIPGVGIVMISNTSPGLKYRGRHAENVSAYHKQAIVDAIKARGFEYERLRDDYGVRYIFCMETYRELGASIPDHPFNPGQITLFQ